MSKTNGRDAKIKVCAMTTLGLPAAVDRTLAVMLTCIPMCMGVLAFTNNIADWTGTVSHVIRPLLTLEALRDMPQFSWRALSASWAPVCYGFVTSIELVVGMVAFVAMVAMLRRFRAPTTLFVDACQWAQRSCTLGIVTWLFFFFVVAGDWFLAWRSASLIGIQRDSLMYAAAATFVLIALRATEARLLRADNSLRNSS